MAEQIELTHTGFFNGHASLWFMEVGGSRRMIVAVSDFGDQAIKIALTCKLDSERIKNKLFHGLFVDMLNDIGIRVRGSFLYKDSKGHYRFKLYFNQGKRRYSRIASAIDVVSLAIYLEFPIFTSSVILDEADKIYRSLEARLPEESTGDQLLDEAVAASRDPHLPKN
jgi:bifunctional DNase/RNase